MFFGKKNRNTSKYHFSKYLFTIAFKKLFVLYYTIKFLFKEENLKQTFLHIYTATYYYHHQKSQQICMLIFLEKEKYVIAHHCLPQQEKKKKETWVIYRFWQLF